MSENLSGTVQFQTNSYIEHHLSKPQHKYLNTIHVLIDGHSVLNSPSHAPFQMPPALCGWTSPRRWWRAAQWRCTARWTVILLPGSPGCLETRSFCGTRRPMSPSPWTMWRLHRREYTPALGTMATASWTLHCTWLSSVSLRDSSCVPVPKWMLYIFYTTSSIENACG